jgi:hypothetical protein
VICYQFLCYDFVLYFDERVCHFPSAGILFKQFNISSYVMILSCILMKRYVISRNKTISCDSTFVNFERQGKVRKYKIYTEG